jgi:hypothetical protein
VRKTIPEALKVWLETFDEIKADDVTVIDADGVATNDAGGFGRVYGHAEISPS